jgi:hypothetical protein
LCATILKRTTVSKRAVTRAQQHSLNLQVEVIAQRDTDAQELYASDEAQDNVVIKQEEDLAMRAH